MKDEHNKATAERAISDNTDKIERERKKLANFEEELSKEEKVLEQIRDSLKGMVVIFAESILLLKGLYC